MSLVELIAVKRDDILRLASDRGARRVRLFGSVARRESTAQSDVDFLVQMAPDRSLLDRIALKQDLEDLLHCSVDVVNERALHSAIRDRVLSESVFL